MIRRLLLGNRPQETRFFVFVGGFGIVLAAIYWFLTYEVAGTVLLAGFGLGAGLIGVGLLRSRPPEALRPADAQAGAGGGAAGSSVDASGGGTGGVDTPFADDSGRLPQATLAPLALGAGLALALTAVVFGPWLLIAGIAPLAWGALRWLSNAGDELAATVEHEASRGEAPGGESPGGEAARGEPAPGRRDATDSARATAVPHREGAGH